MTTMTDFIQKFSCTDSNCKGTHEQRRQKPLAPSEPCKACGKPSEQLKFEVVADTLPRGIFIDWDGKARRTDALAEYICDVDTETRKVNVLDRFGGLIYEGEFYSSVSEAESVIGIPVRLIEPVMQALVCGANPHE